MNEVGHVGPGAIEQKLRRQQEDAARAKQNAAAALSQANDGLPPGTAKSQMIGGGAYATGGVRPGVLVNPHPLEMTAGLMAKLLRQWPGKSEEQA